MNNYTFGMYMLDMSERYFFDILVVILLFNFFYKGLRWAAEFHSRRRHCGQDLERQNKYVSEPCSRGTSHHRSTSGSPFQSQSRSWRNWISLFDTIPPTSALTPEAIATTAGQLTGATPTPGMFPGQLVTPLLMHPQAVAQQATQHARQVCIAGLPPTVNEQSVATFFSQVMAAIGGNSSEPGDSVVNVDINHEKKFAIVEMRSIEEASNAMALHGINFEGSPVVVGRPSDYNHFLAAALGPCHPNPNLNLAAVGLTPHCARALGGPDRIFVGGIPYHFTEAQIRELLESVGTLRCFDLVKDKVTAKSKGHAFCVYQDPSVTDIACLLLNNLKVGRRTLIVKRAYPCGSQHTIQRDNILLQNAPLPMVGRPSDYNPSLTAAQGPSQPYSNLNPAATGLPPGSAGGVEGSDCIFVGGHPCYFTEAQIREVLESFGPLRCFDLLIDRDTGTSKGHFCVYQDPSVTDIVCIALNGIRMGVHTFVVRRAYQDGSQHTLEQESIQASAAGSIAEVV